MGFGSGERRRDQASFHRVSSAGFTRNSCFNAIIGALNDTCDGKCCYTSTTELQLASLEFCIACRNFKTLHLKVDKNIPGWLLAAADALPPNPTQLCGTRVPRLRTRRVTWNMPSAEALEPPVYALTDVDGLEFGHGFHRRLQVSFSVRGVCFEVQYFSQKMEVTLFRTVPPAQRGLFRPWQEL
ncbi:unnamed protein product [Ectocarpus sp. 8 AP-2014]